MATVPAPVLGSSEKLHFLQTTKRDRRIIDLRETINFLKTVQDGISDDKKWADRAAVAGMICIAVSMVTDIIHDSVDIVVSTNPSGAQLAYKHIINPMYDNVRGHKWDGNIYKKEIDRTKVVINKIKKRLPKGETGDLLKKTLDVFGNLAINTIGAIGFSKDSEDARKTAQQSLGGMQKEIERLDKQLNELIRRNYSPACYDDDERSDPPHPATASSSQRPISEPPKVDFSLP